MKFKNLNDLWNFTPTFNKTAFFQAASGGHKETVEILLKQEGIDINMKSVLNQQYS